MPTVRLMNYEWREMCGYLGFIKKKVALDEAKMAQAALSIYNPHGIKPSEFKLWNLSGLIHELKNEYDQKLRAKTATDSELHALWEAIEKLEELEEKYQQHRVRANRLDLYISRCEEAGKRRNGILDQAVDHVDSDSSSASEKKEFWEYDEFGW